MADDLDKQINAINKQLDKFTQQMYFNVARNRTLKRNAGRSTEAAMYLLAPRGDTGNLRRSIEFLPFRKSYDAFVGPNYRKGGSHAHLVNNGFIHHVTKKLVRGRGYQFIQKAYDKTKETVLRQLTKLAQKEFEKIGRKLEVSE